MKHNHKCPKCSGTDIITNARVLTRINAAEGDLTLATYDNPEALLFKGKQSTIVSAWVCAGCGFTEWYAADPNVLRVVS